MDPRAGYITFDIAETYERLGSSEGGFALTRAVIYLAVAPKSDTDYNAYNAVRAFVNQDKLHNVPVHLHNAPTELMKELGYGHVYRYVHNEPEAYATDEIYSPDDLPAQNWYAPTPRGLESKIGKKLWHLRELDAQWHAEQDKSSRNK